MQTIIQVVCKPGISLRESITQDQKLGEAHLRVLEVQRAGRSPGWAKIKSTHADRRGSINIEWIDSTNMLICRIVTKGAGRPNQIAGDFIQYLLGRHGRRVKFITILPG